jgi:hypothetical protein
MKRSLKWVTLCALTGLLICTGARAAGNEASGNRYHGIAERNVFKLQQPKPVVVERPAPVLPKLKLTGITTLLFPKRVFIKVQFPAQPGEPAKEESLMLALGQREAGIEVLEVDEKTGIVKVNNRGAITLLTFDQESVKNGRVP